MFTELLYSFTSTTNLVILLVILIGLYVFGDTHKGRNIPPGPTGLPIVGYLPFMSKNVMQKLDDLKEQYGPVFSMRFGSELVVWLCDYTSMKDAYSKDVFIGRPPAINFQLNPETIETGAFGGIEWKEKRRFSLHLLRDLGLGKSRMESHISEEVQELMQNFESEKGKPFSPSKYLTPSTSNNMDSLMFGNRRPMNDPKRIMLDNVFERSRKVFSVLDWLVFFPYLNALVKFLDIGIEKQRRLVVKDISTYIRGEIKEHQETLDPNHTRDYVDGYLMEMEKRKDDSKKIFQVPILEDMARMFFGAGSETVRNTLDWLLLTVSAKSDVQAKVQTEIDTVVGRERCPLKSDRLRMPYTEAVILEILRWRASLPLNLPRYSLEDGELGSYIIPKGTHIMSNMWAVHHDPKLWGSDVADFKPERFLSKDGKQIVKPEYLIPFSIGKRSCPGESLAYMEVFMYFTAILQKFHLYIPKGQQVDLEGEFNFAIQTKPYTLCANVRE